MKSIPPMNEIFEMAGMELPEFLGRKISDTPATVDVSDQEQTVVSGQAGDKQVNEEIPAQVDDNPSPAAE